MDAGSSDDITTDDTTLTTTTADAAGIPRQLDPPVPVKVNHHSIELSWANQEGQAGPTTGTNRPCYTIDMEDCSKGTKGDFITIYR